MAEEKAPRRRRRWIVFAALVGAGGWYLRTRTAVRPAAPMVPVPRPVAVVPVGDPPAVLDLGRPNPSPVPTSRRPAPPAQLSSPDETAASGRTAVEEPAAVEPAAVDEAAVESAAVAAPGETGPRHMAPADDAPEELSPVSEESGAEPEPAAEPPAAEQDTTGEEPATELTPVVLDPTAEPVIEQAPAQEPVEEPELVGQDPAVDEPATDPAPPPAHAVAVDEAPAASPDAGPAENDVVAFTPARRPRPRPAPPPARRPTPTPRSATPVTEQNGGLQRNGNGSAARPAPQPSGFGPTGVAQAGPHALFTPATEVEPPETSDPTTPVRSDALQPPGADYIIKGSIGSMLFHTPDSPWYEHTEAEVWFRTPEDAIAAGFTAWTTPADH